MLLFLNYWKLLKQHWACRKSDFMKIIHRVGINLKIHSNAAKEFENEKMKMKIIGNEKIGFHGFFDISESDARWPKVKKILECEGLFYTVTNAVFTKKEIKSAKWIYIGPDYMCGYPMPDGYAEYEDISFTGDKQCSSCGIGLEQKATIHLKGEPKMGKKSFMSIFWTYNIFATSAVFEIMAKNGITGYDPLPAIHQRKNTNLKTVMQLSVPRKLDMSIIDDNLVRDKNPCGHLKYNVLTRGMMRFPRQAFEDMPDFVQTCDWFGSGHSAFRLVLASAKFVKIYMENKWKGLSLSPVELV